MIRGRDSAHVFVDEQATHLTRTTCHWVAQVEHVQKRADCALRQSTMLDVAGGPNTLVDAIKAVTRDEVLAVARKYLTPRSLTVLELLPEDKS